jgi:hypothetical protein
MVAAKLTHGAESFLENTKTCVRFDGFRVETPNQDFQLPLNEPAW